MLWFSLTFVTLCITNLKVGKITYVSSHCRIITCKQHLVMIIIWTVVKKHDILAGILKIITEMFLPHIGLSDLEDECFSKILPKVNSKMDGYCLEVVVSWEKSKLNYKNRNTKPVQTNSDRNINVTYKMCIKFLLCSCVLVCLFVTNVYRR